jgi:hypothetical protein
MNSIQLLTELEALALASVNIAVDLVTQISPELHAEQLIIMVQHIRQLRTAIRAWKLAEESLVASMESLAAKLTEIHHM